MRVAFDPSQPDCPYCLGPRLVQPGDDGQVVLVCDRCDDAVVPIPVTSWIPAAVVEVKDTHRKGELPC